MWSFLDDIIDPKGWPEGKIVKYAEFTVLCMETEDEELESDRVRRSRITHRTEANSFTVQNFTKGTNGSRRELYFHPVCVITSFSCSSALKLLVILSTNDVQ